MLFQKRIRLIWTYWLALITPYALILYSLNHFSIVLWFCHDLKSDLISCLHHLTFFSWKLKHQSWFHLLEFCWISTDITNKHQLTEFQVVLRCKLPRFVELKIFLRLYQSMFPVSSSPESKTFSRLTGWDLYGIYASFDSNSWVYVVFCLQYVTLLTLKKVYARSLYSRNTWDFITWKKLNKRTKKLTCINSYFDPLFFLTHPPQVLIPEILLQAQ